MDRRQFLKLVLPRTILISSAAMKGRRIRLNSYVFGFALVLIAAITGGGPAVPLKKRRNFELENIYISCTLAMMLILPFVVAAFVLPNWTEAVHAADAGTVLKGAAYGFGWGLGAVMFGDGVTMAGMPVGFAAITVGWTDRGYPVHGRR